MTTLNLKNFPESYLSRKEQLEGRKCRYPVIDKLGQFGEAGAEIAWPVTVVEYHGMTKDKNGAEWEKVLLFYEGLNKICYGAGDVKLLCDR